MSETAMQDLAMVVPGAWLSMFAKWLPLSILQDLVPFLQQQGLPGFAGISVHEEIG